MISNIVKYQIISKFVISTFVSQRFIFDGKNGQFLLENASSLTHEFLYDNFNKKNYY